MKKMCLFLGLSILIFSGGHNVNASDLNEEYTVTVEDVDSIDQDFILPTNELFNLTYEEPTLDLSRGASIPTNTWNVWQSDYFFNGSSNGGVLYSAYRLYGKGGPDKGKYYVNVNNSGNQSVRVMCKHENKTYTEFIVDGKKSKKITFDNINKDTQWYLRFSNANNKPFSVDGSVK